MINRFFSPRNIYYGAGALESLATVSCQRALITTDRAIRALGMVERVERILQANGAATRIFDQVEAEPSKETAWKAFHLAQEFKPDLFVGLGGGSCMDVGKVAWLLFEHPDLADLPLSESLQVAKSRELRRKARYVAIPTTSGSGSEGLGCEYRLERRIRLPIDDHRPNRLYLPHAVRQMARPERMITSGEVRAAVDLGELVEDCSVEGVSGAFMSFAHRRRTTWRSLRPTSLRLTSGRRTCERGATSELCPLPRQDEAFDRAVSC